MSKIKEFILSHKKISIGAAIVIVLIIAAICIGLALSHRGGKSEKSGEEASSFKNWDDLIADLEEEPVSEFDEVFNDPDSLTGTPYKLMVNKTSNVIIVYEKDKSGKYTKEAKKIICSVGFDTPTGTFTTSDKYTWKIVNGNLWSQYATRVVGNVLIHSMPYTSNDKGTLIPSYYNQLGRTLSAGCIRVSAGDADWIMRNCPKGTTVEIIESDDDIKRPLSIKVPDDAAWDPTDPDDANPWNSVNLAFSGLEPEKTIERGYQFDYMEGVTVTDTCGNDISSQVEVVTDMNVFNTGTYEAVYKVSDATGKTVEQSVKFNVADTQAPKLCGLLGTLYFKSIQDVTKENILEDVKVLDNNQVLSADSVSVVIPPVVEGVNQVTISAADSYNNVMTTTINVIVDSNPPQIALKSGAAKIIPLAVIVDRAFALSRVDITDNGQPVDDLKISISIIPKIWGYNLYYKVSDKQGNTTSFNDEVKYAEYSITPSGNLKVTDINDKSQLLNGVIVKCDDGTLGNTDKLECKVTQLADNKYEVEYSLNYSSPLGDKTTVAKDTFTLKKETASPTPDVPEPDINDFLNETPVPKYTQVP